MKRFLVPIICLAAVILFTIFGITGINKRNSYSDVTATITKITTTVDADNETTHTVEVAYTVDGTEYNTILGEYNSSMDQGETIKIKYNPENPSEIVTASYVSVIIYFVVAFVGLIGMCASVLKIMRGR